MNIELKVMERDSHGVVQQTGVKSFGHPEERASDWVRAPRKMWWGKGDKDVPQLSSAISCKSKGYGSKVPNSFGRLESNGNSVYDNQQLVYFLSGPSSRSSGLDVFPENWRRCIALFCARKTIKSNWINQKDEYHAPNEDHPEYEQWVNDAHIYSLFHSSSQQSSLRNIDYKGDKWDIENEFFWMSNAEMLDLADEQGFVDMFHDAKRFNKDRYMHKQLKGMELSEDAQELLDESKRLVRLSMQMRKVAHQSLPEQNLLAWDSGWYQIRKGILEEYYPSEYTEFVKKYKTFEKRMRKGVFKFGFLKG